MKAKRKIGFLLALFISVPFTFGCEEVKFSFTFNGSNCSINDETNFETKIKEGKKNVSFLIKTDDKYILPEEIIITGKNVNYIKEDGTITISEMKSDVAVTVNAIHGDVYEFSFVGTNCVIQDDPLFTADIIKGERDRVFVITPTEGFILPTKIETECEGVTYNNVTGEISIAEVLGDVKVSAITTTHGYKLSFTGLHCSINGDKYFETNLIEGQTDLHYKIEADSDYVLPKRIDTAYQNCSYDNQSGEITIKTVNSDIAISAVAIYKFQFKFIGTNCAVNNDPNYTCDIIDGEMANFLIEPGSGFLLPTQDEVTIEGPGATYNPLNGVITINNITGNVTVTASATSRQECIVAFDSDGGSAVAPVGVSSGKTISAPSTPTKQDDIWVYKLVSWHKIIKNGIDPNPFAFDTTPIVENMILKAKWEKDYKRTYNAKATDGQRLTFKKNDTNSFDSISITAGEDFVFKMEAINSSNEVEWGVPFALEIYVGDENVPLLEGSYEITPNESETEATVTIFGDYVTGNIKIKGEAVLKGLATCLCYYYHGTSSEPTFQISYKETRNAITIDFNEFMMNDENPSLPKAENIWVNIDNFHDTHVWVSPAEGYNHCTYDETTGILTILPTYIKKSISVMARSYDYKLLDMCSWDYIAGFGKSNVAPYLFYIGEKKTILFNGVAHQVMIVGYNEDRADKDGSTTHPYTFEFYNIVSTTDVRGLVADNTAWHATGPRRGCTDDYRKSDINNYCGEWRKKLPADLQEVIKPAFIDIDVAVNGVFEPVIYESYLFPIAHNEMFGNSGERYTYYNEFGDYKRKIVGHSDYEDYWTRSPYATPGEEKAWKVNEREPAYSRYSATPCFCI